MALMPIVTDDYGKTKLEQYADEICGTLDCLECPFFTRFDVCATEYCTNLYEEV